MLAVMNSHVHFQLLDNGVMRSPKHRISLFSSLFGNLTFMFPDFFLGDLTIM